MIGVALPTIDKESHLSCWGERGKKYNELFTGSKKKTKTKQNQTREIPNKGTYLFYSYLQLVSSFQSLGLDGIGSRILK
jgi:hypothetical protein